MSTLFKIPGRLIQGSGLDIKQFLLDHGYTMTRRAMSPAEWQVTVSEDLTDTQKSDLNTALMTALNRVSYDLGYVGEPDAHARTRYKEVMDLCVTQRLNTEGFEHPSASGRIFSLSLPAQIKWLGLLVSKDSMTYPYDVPVKDDSEVYSIADAAEVATMWGAIMTKVSTVLGEATAEKAAIDAAADVAAARASAVAHLNTNGCSTMVALLGP